MRHLNVKSFLMSLMLILIPSAVYAEEATGNELSFWSILISILVPAILIIIAYLIIKMLKV